MVIAICKTEEVRISSLIPVVTQDDVVFADIRCALNKRTDVFGIEERFAFFASYSTAELNILRQYLRNRISCSVQDQIDVEDKFIAFMRTQKSDMTVNIAMAILATLEF